MTNLIRTMLAITLMIGAIQNTKAQFVVFNNGAEVTVSQGCIVTILTGDLDNDSGVIDNAGRITVDGDLSNDDEITGAAANTGIFNVSGNWENNNTFTADQSLVNLNGANQSVTGSAITSFYNLHLLGSGIKSLNINSEVTGGLVLNNLELATQGNLMSVLNPATTAITATSGFVSSTGNGRISWDMNSTGTYVFPLGSSVGTPRIRPLAITPTSASSNTFAVRMANVNATTEGFNVNSMDPELCIVNPLFFHLVDHVSGSDAVGVTQYYNAAQDGSWDNGAHWQNAPQWEGMGGDVLGTNGVYTTVTNPNWSDFGDPAFALAHAIPTVTLQAVSPICESASPVSLVANPSGGLFVGTGVSNGTFDPAGAGEGTHNVTYIYTDNFGCTNSAEIDILVEAAPTVTITSSNNGALQFCSGGSLDLIATAGFADYDWNTGEQTGQITVTAGGPYWVTVTDANGCEATSVVANVTVQPVPSPIATALGPVLFCEGETVTLSTATGMGSYLWELTGSITPSTVVSESGDYWVTVTNQYGCSGVSNTITVEVTPMDEAVIIEDGNNLTVDPPGSDYQWYLNGDPIPGANGLTYDAIQSGNYHVEYIGPNGCPTSTYILEFTVHIGVDEQSVFNLLDLYPNPGKGEFVIRGVLPTTDDITVELTNMLGQLLQPAVVISNAIEFSQPMDISGYANGVYFVRIRVAGEQVTIRYIKS